ncbi:MAG: hypothetical protein IT236_01340 [Bacteroidia bacterium]|nr:hypothetical protein [Bacteroidia bacterium]
MSLDSVELVVNFEKHFQIHIPDKVAENVGTLQEAVDAISALLNIRNNSFSLQDKIFGKLQEAILKLKSLPEPPTKNQLVINILGELTNEKILFLSNELQLNIPPAPPDKAGIKQIKKWFLLAYQPDFTYANFTLADFTDIICAANSKELVRVENISEKYEVYIHLAKVLSDHLGIDLYEIRPHKSFTNDFGID